MPPCGPSPGPGARQRCSRRSPAGGTRRGRRWRATGAGCTGSPRGTRSEGVLGADLHSSRIAHHLAWLPNLPSALCCIDLGGVIAEVRVVKDVEHIDGHAEAGARDLREVLAEPDVYAPVG